MPETFLPWLFFFFVFVRSDAEEGVELQEVSLEGFGPLMSSLLVLSICSLRSWWFSRFFLMLSLVTICHWFTVTCLYVEPTWSGRSWT